MDGECEKIFQPLTFGWNQKRMDSYERPILSRDRRSLRASHCDLSTRGIFRSNLIKLTRDHAIA